jgi:hypothetical protein
MAAVAADPGAQPGSRRERLVGAAVAALRPEDLLLLGWVALATPLLSHVQGSGDPFAQGRPLDGLFRLAGVLGALICLGTRTAGPAGDRAPVVDGSFIGPAGAGLMLVGASAFAGLGLAPEAAFLPVFGAVVILPLLRGRTPALPANARRALVTPFVLAAGGIFWDFTESITGSGNLFGDPGALLAPAPAVAPVLGVLVLIAAVYYAMLVYAPRQIAEREGGPLAWLARYVLFVAGVVLGFGWLSVLGT